MARKSRTLPAELPEATTVSAEEILRSVESGETDLICILGPTASGKTAYAVRLAEELDSLSGRPRAEIISADSRQVYRGMDIGTGKDIEEYRDIPYHLIDIRPAGDKYNAYQFTLDFRDAYDKIRSRGGIPILCGGTGLYINAVTCGYDFKSNHPLSEARDVSASGQGCFPKTFFIGTLVSREMRRERIDKRLDARLDEGMVDEIRALLDGTSAGCPVAADGSKIPVPAETLIAYGLEYRFVTLHLLGELSYDEMKQHLATAIHQFAKRQMTWFRGMERAGTDIHWVEV